MQTDLELFGSYTERLCRALSNWHTRPLKQPGVRSHRTGFYYPDEHLACCIGLRPTEAYPNKLIDHCKTYKHVACRHNVLVADLRYVVKGGSINACTGDTDTRGNAIRVLPPDKMRRG